ncbi:hypothetical protein Q1695_010335 [Nippostrongylus brasiliensis]|nr:hypothetical protein Q1695_010335 [Nippostrongylus brasiliensis]
MKFYIKIGVYPSGNSRRAASCLATTAGHLEEKESQKCFLTRLCTKHCPAWNHPAGPKTIFFWAPLIKWCLVIAGLADLARPPQKLSASQNAALTATGAVWTRYSFVIIPKNYSLASVNFFVMCCGLTQLGRIAHYRSTHPEARSP